MLPTMTVSNNELSRDHEITCYRRDSVTVSALFLAQARNCAVQLALLTHLLIMCNLDYYTPPVISQLAPVDPRGG